MSGTYTKKMLVGLMVTTFTVASAGAAAGDRYDDSLRRSLRRPRRCGYDYARVVDVEPLVTRVRVSTPQRECWDETRVDNGGYREGPFARSNVGGTLLGAAIGAAIGNQIGSGRGRRAATVGGAVVGAAIGHRQAEQRNGQYGSSGRETTVQRCETRYHDEWQERVDGYRVTYVYNGRRQVTEMPNRPGDRIRVRVDVSPAE